MRVITIAFAVLVFAGEVFAQTLPRTIDMTAPFVSLDGVQLKGDGDRQETLGSVVARVLMQVPDQKATLQELLQRGDLAKRVKDNPKAEMTSEEIALVKRLLVEGYKTPMVVMPAVCAIDPAEKGCGASKP